jgi:hypothetical protein
MAPLDTIREHTRITADESNAMHENHVKINLSASGEFLNPEVFKYPLLFTAFFAFETCLLGSYLRWRWPDVTTKVVYLIIAVAVVLAAAALVQAVRVRADMKMRVYFAAQMLLAAYLGYVAGNYVHDDFVGPYFTYNDLKVYHGVNPKKDVGTRYPDIGIAYFTPGVQLLRTRNMCLKNDNAYCVAPIVNCAPYGDCGELKTDTGSFDYWAVGKDCCGCPEGEFRCGDWNNPITHGGLRQIDDHDLLYYKLAVKEWEAAYGVQAKTPIFFHWELRPQTKARGLFGRGMYMVVILVGVFLCVQVTISFTMDALGII